MTGPYPPPQPDPAHHGPPPDPAPQFSQPQYGQPQYGQPQYGQPQFMQPQFAQPQFSARPGRPPRDRMGVALVAIIGTLLVLCLAMAVGSVYFLREEPGGDDKTSEIVDHRPAGG